jgi:hypothetical protein
MDILEMLFFAIDFLRLYEVLSNAAANLIHRSL